MADLSKEKGQEHVPGWAFTGFNLHRNTGHTHKAHQSLSGRNYQIIDNKQRTLRAYSELGSVSYKGYKTLGNKLISGLDPYHLN